MRSRHVSQPDGHHGEAPEGSHGTRRGPVIEPCCALSEHHPLCVHNTDCHSHSKGQLPVVRRSFRNGTFVSVCVILTGCSLALADQPVV